MRRALASLGWVGSVAAVALMGCGRLRIDRVGAADASLVLADVGPSDARAPLDASDAARDAAFDAARDGSFDGSDVLDGGTDAMIDAGDTSCAARYPGALWCEDFEGAELDLFAFATVQSTTVHRGAFALRAASDGATLGGVRYPLPAAATRLHLRAFLRVEGSFAVGSGGWIVLMQLQNEGITQKLSADIVPGSVWQLAKGIDPVQYASGAATVVERGRWLCVEAAIVIAASGSASLHVDGTPIVELTNVNTVPAQTPLERLAIGIVAANRVSAPFDVYVDDVVLATAPIGCD